MENSNNNNNSGRALSGLIIVFVGLAFLLNNIGMGLPHWVFSWHTLLLIIGIFIGIRRQFRGAGWLIMVLIGGYFTLDDIAGIDFDFSKYALGIGLVILGGFLIFRPKYSFKNRGRFRDRFNQEFNDPNADTGTSQNLDQDINNNDVIEVVSVFGGSHQTVYSKNFRGGDITAVFGGADINLTQADFNNTVKLDVTAVFGGIKLVVPQNWAIKSNVTAIFGSVEDKRSHVMPQGEIQKTLVLDGTAMFGGIEIKSF
ncbi:LiaF transmembrane domain-containing protein [Pedobacter punctiformis]|uniref:LiaF-related protein n=1 Tax=Pedobacter punctiformis TaxID=3004097 RepID=A0ABT4LCT8_9SPHI|nr:LiaF domain-containing protein [Pedobacter sp. HCMS5-2]MCZ4245736.1 LiaF-related protein [Pedobacter sp. HCMS5-2]